VKRSGKDEPMGVVIHVCVKAMLGVFLYSYPYLQPAKMLCLSYHCLYLLFNKIGQEARQVLPGSEVGAGEREGVEGMEEK
jgi:hypothetical protein